MDQARKDNSPEPWDNRREEFALLFKRGAEFTEELLKENERLRYCVADLQARLESTGSDSALMNELLSKVKRLELERVEMHRRFQEVEDENKTFADRYVDIEEENNKLMNIYIAIYQLHSTLDFADVLKTITEIMVNFIGAESFVVGLCGDHDQRFRPLVVENVAPSLVDRIGAAQGVFADVLTRGEPYFGNDDSLAVVEPSQVPNGSLTLDGQNPRVCIPLRIKERTFGLVVVFSFLKHKSKITTVDREIFTLLAAQAATAIFAAKLYTDSTRKLHTLQELIGLVTS